MTRDPRPVMPPELQTRLADLPPDRRRDLHQVWRLLGQVGDATPDVSPPDVAWAELQQRLDPPRPSARRRAPDRRASGRPAARPRRRAGFVWLAAVVLVVTGGLWWRTPVVVHAPPGRQVTMQLPDGSTVQLNSGTRLSYGRGFARWPFLDADRRRVALDGEAFFDVRPDGRPFEVETFNARVEVLGTRFNVRARREAGSEATEVTLASGRVRVVAPGDTTRAVVLAEAGAAARVAGADLPAVRPDVPLDRVLSWRRRGFSAVDQPLAAILAEFERRYALDVDVEDRIPMSHSMSLFYGAGAKPEVILHDICLAGGWQFRRTSQGFAIFRPAPTPAE